MDVREGIELIEEGIAHRTGRWADIGAGTGLFSKALDSLLTDGVIFAVDKSPHALWSIADTFENAFEIIEADFNQPLPLEDLDGMVAANALHYAENPKKVLSLLVSSLKPGGTFILIEYETDRPNRWVPYPIRFEKFAGLCQVCGLTEPRTLSTRPSMYGHEHMYSAVARK